MKTDVCNYAKTCSTCQQLKYSVGLQQQWQEMPAVDKPLKRVSMDIVDMVGGTQGFRYALTILDHYSRYTILFPLKTKATEGVCEAFSSYIADFEAPKAVLVDNGGEFSSASFQNLYCTNHITLCHTTPYHPQGNSISERYHRTLKSVLATLCQGHPLWWPRLLPTCQKY